MKRNLWLVAMVAMAMLTLAAPGSGADKKEKTEAAPASPVVDSGSFGIFINGKRVATEKFKIERVSGGSVASSELTVDDASQKAAQLSELKLSAMGNLQSYSWKEESPGQGTITVEPKEVPSPVKGDPSALVVMETVSPSPSDKAQEVPFFVPTSTPILDDNFFSHRELLAWRYLGAVCQQGLGRTTCRFQRMRFGVIVPRQAVFIVVYLDHVGKERVKVGETERELTRLNLTGEGINWALWLDDQYKLVRILVPSDNTEVLRD